MWRLRGRGFFLVGAVVWALTIAYLPSVEPVARRTLEAANPDGSATPVAGADGVAPAAGAAGPASAGGPARGGPTAPAAAPASRGIARSGVVCGPGVKQVPDTAYAPPCRPKFTGDNGGATSNGVTRTTIRMANRYFAASAIAPGSRAPDATVLEILRVFLAYFNDNYELYGRRVEIEHFQARSDYLTELSGKGRDAACADAIALAQEHHDFGLVYSDTLPFMDCAASQGLVLTFVEGRPNEPFLAARDPYIWAVQQECHRISHQMAEYMGKRLAHRPARYAGDPAYVNRTRKFGLMLPDVPGYQDCYAIVGRELRDRYGVKDVVEFHYVADLASASEQVSRAAIKFKSEGVTTVAVFGPALATQYMTQGAKSQDWRPEWVNNGVGGSDSDINGQSYDQTEVDGHMFGRSEYASEATSAGPDSEAGRLYRKLTGKNIPAAYGDGGFMILNQLFTLLQEAGPNLTPFNLGQGARALPTRVGPQGTLSYRFNPDGTPGFSHGATLDSNEIWYDGSIVGSNGKRGGFRVSPTRYRGGEWPATPPEVYPGR